MTRLGAALSIGLAALLAACAPYQSRTLPETGSGDIINPERSDRGNPPFYEVFGERHYVLSSSDGYRDTGVASWYGRDFQGNLTSSGERYDMYAFTAAHKTLPIPTWVEVTNRSNGRTVIVKVNDRGPFVDDRIIDLSYAAALQIGMVRNGTAPVFVRALGAPGNLPTHLDRRLAEELERGDIVDERLTSPAPGGQNRRPPPPAVAPVASTDDGGIFVQVGAFTDLDNAVRLLEQLKENGFVNSILHSDNGRRSPLHRVRIGPLATSNQFDFIREGLSLIGITDMQLVVEP